jgi:hypothetical protein
MCTAATTVGRFDHEVNGSSTPCVLQREFRLLDLLCDFLFAFVALIPFEPTYKQFININCFCFIVIILWSL